MRVDITTGFIVKDKDLRALVLLEHAMRISTPRMREHNLNFVLDKWGFHKTSRDSIRAFQEAMR